MKTKEMLDWFLFARSPLIEKRIFYDVKEAYGLLINMTNL